MLKMNLFNSFKIAGAGFFLLLAIILPGCSTQKQNISYFTDLKNTPQGVLNINAARIRIVPDDILQILVSSDRPEATAIYNDNGNQHRYRVNERGEINFPFIGRIKVEGMTTEELAAYLTGRIEEHVVDPYVTVDLENFRVEVLGEVEKPGVIPVNRERFSVLDALAAAGDITAYGVRDNILLLRQEDGVTKYYHLDLNDSKTMTLPEFYMQQNDVLIVEPNNIKKDNSRYNTNNAYKLQVISTVVSASSVLASLAIALAVK